MSDKISGQVFRVYPKTFPGKPETYSVKLEDNPIYYRLGTKRFGGIVEPGNRIEFFATMNSDGKSARVDGDVKPLAAIPAAAGTPSLAPSGTQAAIQYQAARKDALVLVGMILEAKAVKLPAKQADLLGAVEDLVDHYTAKFFEDTSTLGAVTRALEGGEAPAETVEATDEE